jgi:transposase-like protein
MVYTVEVSMQMYSVEDRMAAIAAYQAGMPFQFVKETYGFSRTALRHWIKKLGVQKRPVGRPRGKSLQEQKPEITRTPVGSAAWMQDYMRMASES